MSSGSTTSASTAILGRGGCTSSVEKSGPATFQYPLWSFACDLLMVSHMLRGRPWTGDPLEELGLAPA